MESQFRKNSRIWLSNMFVEILVQKSFPTNSENYVVCQIGTLVTHAAQSKTRNMESFLSKDHKQRKIGVWTNI